MAWDAQGRWHPEKRPALAEAAPVNGQARSLTGLLGNRSSGAPGLSVAMSRMMGGTGQGLIGRIQARSNPTPSPSPTPTPTKGGLNPPVMNPIPVPAPTPAPNPVPASGKGSLNPPVMNPIPVPTTQPFVIDDSGLARPDLIKTGEQVQDAASQTDAALTAAAVPTSTAPVAPAVAIKKGLLGPARMGGTGPTSVFPAPVTTAPSLPDLGALQPTPALSAPGAVDSGPVDSGAGTGTTPTTTPGGTTQPPVITPTTPGTGGTPPVVVTPNPAPGTGTGSGTGRTGTP